MVPEDIPKVCLFPPNKTRARRGSGARPQNSGWSLIRCGGVFFLYLTAYDVVRQEAPDDHFLKGSSRETRATQGRSDADQRSSSRLSHCPIPQVWQAELPLCTERLPGARDRKSTR